MKSCVTYLWRVKLINFRIVFCLGVEIDGTIINFKDRHIKILYFYMIV